jgi:phosphonate transport system substrate-binding protein
VPPLLDSKLKENLRNLFLNIHTDENGRLILEKLYIDKFVVLEDDRYDSIRKMQSSVLEK